MEIALRYKLFTLSTLFTLFYSVFTSLLPPLTLFTYCIHIVEWFERHEKALWLDEQNKISFAANLRIEEIVPLNTYENTYRSWKIGSEEKDGGAKHWHRIAHNKHHFPEIVTFSSIKILKITLRAYHYQPGLLPAKSFTGTNTQKNSNAKCKGAH